MSSSPASTSIHHRRTSNNTTTKTNAQVHNGPERSLNREIPEENLLTLGTLRYGIRMSSSPRVTERRSMSFPSSTGTNSTSSTNLSRIPSTNSSVPTSSLMQNGNKDKDCCCIGSSSLPWMHHSHGEHHHHQFNNGSGVHHNNNQMTRSTKLPMPAGVSSSKNRIVSQSSNYPQTTTAQYSNHQSSLLTSSKRETSPPTVCCYNSSGGQSLNQSNSSNNKNQNKSNILRYTSVRNKKNCDNVGSSKIRVKSDPCLGGLSVNLVEINDKDDDDGKNHHKLLLSNTKLSTTPSSSSYVISNGGSNCVSAIKNRSATVLCKPVTATTTTTTDYSNNFCVNNNNNKTQVNYLSNKNRTKNHEPSEKLENLNLLNCFTSKVVRDSRSSSVCLDAASENTSVSEDLSTDVSVSSSLRKSESQKSSLTINSSIKSDTSSVHKSKYASRNGNLIHKLLPPAITSFKKTKDFPESNTQLDTKNKQIICRNLADHANNLNFIDCSSSGEVSLVDDAHLIRPLPQSNYSASPKRSFLHTIPTVSSPLLVHETTQKSDKINFKCEQSPSHQIKIKEFYEQKTLSNATDLHKFKSNSHNNNQQHTRYKTIASEYPNIGWNPNENYPNNQIFYESVSSNERIKTNNVPYLNQVPATVPRNNNNNNISTKNLKYYQTQGVSSEGQVTKSQQDLQKQNLIMERRRTLDKLHRLGFGKRSASTEVKPSSKAEKLRELTELLKGSRGSSSSAQTTSQSSNIPVPPPLPPPLPPPVPLRNKRKPKSLQQLLRSQPSTDSDPSESFSSLPPIDSEPSISFSSPALEIHSSGTISPNSIPSSNIGSPEKQSLRPNSSTSNLETAKDVGKELYENHSSKSTNYLNDDEFLTKLTRPEARQIIGSYTQSTIPFRSASFSQADYQNYKYRQKTSLDEAKDRKSKVHFEISDNKPEHVDKSTDTNRYPERSEINLSLGENGRLTETGEVEVATEATEINSSSKRNSDIETIEEETPNESTSEFPPDLKIVQASEVELEPLVEEEAPLTPTLKSEEQKASTCVIPIPVYDSVVKEWSTTSPSEQWIQSGETVEVKNEPNHELTKGMSFESKCCEIETDNILDVCQNPEGKIEEHTSVEETSGALASNELKDALEITEVAQESTEVTLRDSQTEFPEVRKRHSNNDSLNYQISDSGANSPLLSPTEEKRRIDKSKRRKGIYIQWPAVENAQETSFDRASSTGDATPPWQCSITPEVFESGDLDTPVALQVPETQEIAPSDSGTPDVEKSAPVFKDKDVQRGSLTYQSSDEKDDSLMLSNPLRQFKNLFIRGDSVSDNECDRTHDRLSASPAPHAGDTDVKRYSKRPLRGPYGQMLEAEMKKPSPKMHYEELLEELNRKVENCLSPIRGRGISSLSFDESSIPQSHKLKNRKSHTLLPVPSHTRTASSPSQLLELTQRTPSPIPQTHTDTEKPNKKLSLDFHATSLDAKPKRASSDTTDKHSKRSSSSASDKSDKHGRYSSRTPSERSFILHTPETPKGPVPSPELLAELLKGSSEKLTTEQHQRSSRSSTQPTQPPVSDFGCDLPPAILKCLNVSDADQRIHVVIELYNTEQNYVDSLQTIVNKYMNPLKSPENSGLIDPNLVDEIFFMIPSILNIHERFLDELKRRFETWDPMQKVGDAFIEVFSHPSILETYTSFINNSPKAKQAIRTACSQRPQFRRFLSANAREHRGKLTLDHLLIKPVQRFPGYELIFGRLIKLTDVEHPDQKSLQEASKLIHDILLHINCMENEALENGHREATLKDLESVVEGINDLVTPDRTFLLFELVTMPIGQGTRKERGFFLFSDLLVITSIKRRNGTIRKLENLPDSVAKTLDTHKYKLLTKIALDDVEIVKSKDENVRRIMKEIEQLTEDCNKLQQISELTVSLRCQHQVLEDTIRDLQREIQRQLNDRQSNDSQLSQLELTLNSPTGAQPITVVFVKPDKRTQWEEALTEAKQKLATSVEKHPTPEFISSVPIRKTRAGLQFTCASPTLGGQKDVWVCNSDGYVGQVCVLSLLPEPTVTSCNGVCNARILCVASVPASIENQRNSQLSSSPVVNASIDEVKNSQLLSNKTQQSPDEPDDTSNVRLESSSSSDDSEGENTCDKSQPISPPVIIPQHQQQDSIGSNVGDEGDNSHNQSTMWLGTEDGCIHVYNCTDNIRIKKNKIKIQHVSAVYSILYLDNRVFVSLANGDILVYTRDHNGWNTTTPLHISVGTVTEPVTKLLNVLGKLWCSIQGIIKILNTSSLHVENQIQISNESKPITNMAALSNCVWISIQNSAHIKCFHSTSYELLFEVNLAPSVNKMLSNCDDIIRQHKAACLRVTSLLACKDLIWVGTSAGVLLTIPAQGLSQGSAIPPVTGIPHGHTGHVRFLTTVETSSVSSEEKSNRLSMHGKIKTEMTKTLVISGGDGYEDFRCSGNNTMSEVAGREDSTNHLLLWEV